MFPLISARDDPLAPGSHLTAGFVRFPLPAPRSDPSSQATLCDLLCYIPSHRTGTRTPVSQHFVTPRFFDPNLIDLERMFPGFPAPHEATGAPSSSHTEPTNSLASPEGPSPHIPAR